jgi:hypothetical protein
MEMERTMQQMLELLLAKQEEMLAKMKADREKRHAEMKAIRAKTKAMRDKRMEANRESNQEELKGMMEEMNAKADGKQEEMLARMREAVKSSQAKMRSTVCAMWSELEENIKSEMRAVIQPIWAELDGMTTCREGKEIEPDPGMMQSIEEHQIPKEDATVMPVGEPRKRHRVCNLATERHQKRKERTLGYCRSRRSQLLPARRCPAGQKWHGKKRNLFRRTGTQESCGSQKRVTVTDRKLTHDTGVVWLKEKVRMHYEGRQGLEDLGSRLPLCPRNKRTSSWTYRKTINSAKQKASSFAVSLKIKDTALWRGRPPPK